MATARQRGRHWEQVAESFLKRRGLKTLERNYQTPMGEIDLVMLDGNTLVFTEVRYRASGGHGTGADSVTWTKQQRIIRAARRFLQCRCHCATRHCRFDVVSISAQEGRTLIDWIPNAFDAP